MKTTNLKKSMADILFVKAQFDALYEADKYAGDFMNSLVADMAEKKVTPDDFFAGFCYATFEHQNKTHPLSVRCEDTDIIPDTKHTPEHGSKFARHDGPCEKCPIRTGAHSSDWQTRICPTCPLHDPDNMPDDGGDEIDGAWDGAEANHT